jgi:uncharacterized protein (DUF983 family)
MKPIRCPRCWSENTTLPDIREVRVCNNCGYDFRFRDDGW